MGRVDKHVSVGIQIFVNDFCHACGFVCLLSVCLFFCLYFPFRAVGREGVGGRPEAMGSNVFLLLSEQVGKTPGRQQSTLMLPTYTPSPSTVIALQSQCNTTCNTYPDMTGSRRNKKGKTTPKVRKK